MQEVLEHAPDPGGRRALRRAWRRLFLPALAAGYPRRGSERLVGELRELAEKHGVTPGDLETVLKATSRAMGVARADGNAARHLARASRAWTHACGYPRKKGTLPA